MKLTKNELSQLKALLEKADFVCQANAVRLIGKSLQFFRYNVGSGKIPFELNADGHLYFDREVIQDFKAARESTNARINRTPKTPSKKARTRKHGAKRKSRKL